jgi:ankyrin repeat protein
MKSIQIFFLCFLSLQLLAHEQNSIFHAISQNNTQLVKKMLKDGQYADAVNNDGQTILHAAVLTNNWKAVQVIFASKQINVNQLDKYNKTAMDYAVEYGHNKMVRNLYKNNGQMTSAENASYAQKIITRPFKIIFFIGLPLLIISLYCLTAGILLICSSSGSGFCDFFNYIVGIGILTEIVPGIGIPGVILTATGISGWATRSHKNLLIPTT